VTLAKATELCDRLEGREPDRGQVVDLPAVPLGGTTVNWGAQSALIR
jgi:hypothetical protein